MVVGAWLYKFEVNSTAVRLAVLIWVFSFAATALLTWMHSKELGKADETFYEYTSPFIVIGAAAAFISLRVFFNYVVRKGSYIYSTLIALGKVNFGIYLLHVMVILVLDMYGVDYKYLNPWISFHLFH